MIRSLYFVILLFVCTGLTCEISVASNQGVQIALPLRDLKNSIQVIVIDTFGSTPEAQTVQGQRLIELQKERIKLLEAGIAAALSCDWEISNAIKVDYCKSNNEVFQLQNSFEFFKNLR